jgi:hypothetical protein
MGDKQREAVDGAQYEVERGIRDSESIICRRASTQLQEEKLE